VRSERRRRAVTVTVTGDRLPIADRRQVRRAAAGLIRADRATALAVVLLNGLAAGAATIAPALLGQITDTVAGPDPGGLARVDALSAGILAAAVAQTLLTRYATLVAYRFGERTAARVREGFLDRALALPAADVERVAGGDLTARGTGDVTQVSTTLRDAVPSVLVATAEVVFIFGAVLLLQPLLGTIAVVCTSGLALALRWYLRRSRAGYLAEGAASSTVAEVLSTTAAGARTVETLGLRDRRIAAGDEAVGELRRARLYTLYLRSVLFPAADVSFALPVAAVLLIGGILADRHAITPGTAVACAYYLRQLVGPLSSVLFFVEALQSSTAAFARIEGLAAAPKVGDPTDAEPADDRIEVTGVRYAYGQGVEVLHGVDLSIRPGERLAVVGPSGAGKTTLGRLLAGVDSPGAGTVTVGGVPVAALAPERLRRQVVLVTQEQHVFADRLRDNLTIAAPGATDDELRAALATVGAGWVDDLPDGLDTALGVDTRLSGAQAQQVALARVVLADPHTVILDEATALLDPAAARDAERALGAVLSGRTVIAIAHRLQTAHDADRVAVMEHGRVTELGSHDELVAAGGAYAALWRSWHGDIR
jgi:ATP-binding cassette subfamily C protein